MIKGENSDSIPIDLIIEILSRLPAKSISRFRFVSKLWCSMFLRPYFTDLFLQRSSARPPCLLFAVEGNGDEWCFFTSLQPQNPSEESSSLVVTADVHMKFLGNDKLVEFCGRASGLICFRQKDDKKHLVLCNPSTGQFASLTLPKGGGRGWRSFLGFDPIDKQFKVLYITWPNYYDQKEEPDQILTLGTGKNSWREIHCPLNHYPRGEGLSINGVLYYLAEENVDGYFGAPLIVCFDVRHEKFKFIYIHDLENHTQLINYKGKLAMISLKYARWSSLELCLWVINDVVKPESEWEYFSYFWHDKVADTSFCSVSGVTATGEIVLYMFHASKPFYIFYWNVKRNTLQSVEIKGFGADHFDNSGRCLGVKVFVDHVEDLKFIMMKKTTYATKSISPPENTSTSTTSTSAKSIMKTTYDATSISPPEQKLNPRAYQQYLLKLS